MRGSVTGESRESNYNFQRTYVKLLVRQWKEIKTASSGPSTVEETATGEGSDRVTSQRLKELALVESVSRRWITDTEGLEDKDETTSCTPLLSHSFLGDVVVTELLNVSYSPVPR